MNRLDFNEDGKEWELLFNFRWPHEGFSIGYDIFPADENVDFVTIYVHLGLLSIILHYN